MLISLFDLYEARRSYKIISVRLTFCLSVLPGDNTEKISAHQFLAKPKTIAAGGDGGSGEPWKCPGGGKAPIFFLFSV